MTDYEKFKQLFDEMNIGYEETAFKNERMSIHVTPDDNNPEVVTNRNGWLEVKFNSDESFDRIVIC